MVYNNSANQECISSSWCGLTRVERSPDDKLITGRLTAGIPNNQRMNPVTNVQLSCSATTGEMQYYTVTTEINVTGPPV